MTTSSENPQNTPSYTQEEVQEILQNAIARKLNNQDKFTQEQLLEMARELEIPSETLKAAEEEWLQQQAKLRQKQAFEQDRWKKIKHSWGRYLIVNAFLIIINLLTSDTISWAIFPLLGWGLSLALETWQAYTLKGEDYDRALEKWQNQKSS